MAGSKATILKPAYRGNGLLQTMIRLATTWQTRMRARRALARLDAHMLRDIGLDPLTAERESCRPFWRD
ncbi:MAG: DUF1127 domain-containing protein [Rhodobacteraceae bacterium]|nr:DUF1127 domain-containing protein [Paracoccaceae bacterium]